MDLIIGSINEYALSADDPKKHEKIFYVFAKISQALSQLHQMGISHLDVKPENIIIQENESLHFWILVEQLHLAREKSNRVPLSICLRAET